MPTLPLAQSARIQEINRVFWESLDESLDTLDDVIAARARLAMARIRKSNYSPRVIRRETRKMTKWSSDRAYELVAQQVEMAALYAQRAADVVRAWQVAGRLKEGVEHLTVSDSAMARARLPGASVIDAEAALSRIKLAPLRTPAEQRKALEVYGSKVPRAEYTGPTTSGTRAMDRLRRVGLVKKSKEIGLSERLHGSAARNVTETERAVGTAIREASNMNKAARDLVNTVRKGGDDLSINKRLTRPLRRLRRAGRNLQQLSVNQGDEDALRAATAEFNKAFDKVKGVAGRLVDQRGGYQELIQIVEKQGHQGVDKALSRWLDEKQSYHAERIVETETAAAYRAREYSQHANKPYIIGFFWRRNVGMAKLDIRRRKDIALTRTRRRAGRKSKRKTKGRPCSVCPSLADNFYPVEYAREFPRGAHPLCRCWYEWVYDHSKLDNSPITAEDVSWFESLPD